MFFYKLKMLMMVLFMLTACLFSSCKPSPQANAVQNGGDPMTLQVTSEAFGNGGMIPPKYTADGQDMSPPLSWGPVPQGTQSIALIADDPDAPMGTWVHWLMWNIPPEQTKLTEDIPTQEEFSNGIVQGTTSFKRVGYGGPAPPSGTHRYYFKFYALDIRLDLGSKADKKALENAMQGHILAQGQVMGKYSRQR